MKYASTFLGKVCHVVCDMQHLKNNFLLVILHHLFVQLIIPSHVKHGVYFLIELHLFKNISPLFFLFSSSWILILLSQVITLKLNLNPSSKQIIIIFFVNSSPESFWEALLRETETCLLLEVPFGGTFSSFFLQESYLLSCWHAFLDAPHFHC